MISIQSRPDALCARSFLQLRTIFCRFAVLLDFRGFRCYSVTTRSGHLILCGAICGVLALFHLPAKYIAFFCAIFILLLACVSAKYLKGSRMQSVPSCTFSQNRAFVCFLSPNLLISFQPLPIYYFFKQSLRFFTWKLIALSTKINAMVLCTLKQKTPFNAAAIMFCAAAA